MVIYFFVVTIYCNDKQLPEHRTMNITSKYLHNIIDNRNITHNKIVSIILSLKSTIPDFSGVTRVVIEDKGDITPIYTLTPTQAVMVITSIKDESIVYLIRDLIRLEDNKSLPLTERATDNESEMFMFDAASRKYSDLGKAISNQSASLDMVDVAKSALLSFKSDNEHTGVCSLYEFKELLSSTTNEPLTLRYIIFLIVKNTTDYKRSLIRKNNRIYISLEWILHYLDLIIYDILHNVKETSDLSSKVDKTLRSR